MFLWKQRMVEENSVDSRLLQLDARQRAAFAAACAQHALLRFERLRLKGEYTSSRSDYLATLLSVLQEVWLCLNCGPTPTSAAEQERRLDLLVGKDFAEVVGYNEAELLIAVEQTLECLNGDAPIKSVMSAAQNAYDAASKWFVAKAFPGKPLTAEKIERFEEENPDCAAEFEFQLSSLKLLEGFAGKTLSYPLFADKH